MGTGVIEPHPGALGDDEENNKGEGQFGEGRAELSIKSRVSSDGEKVNFHVRRGNRVGPHWVLSYGEASLIYHEIRASLGVATGRQRMSKDLAKEAIADLCRTALRPTALGYQVDPDSGDVFIVHFFEDHAPFCVRCSQHQLQEGRALVMAMLAKTAN